MTNELTEPRQLFAPALGLLVRAFRRLEGQVPPPKRKPWKDSFVFRYTEKTIQQAIVQKLARTIASLYSVDILLNNGLFQDQGTVQRVLDEIEEDVIFLSLAIINGDMTARHQEYLDHFYAEEFQDSNDIMGSHSSRGMVRREKIRAYINKGTGSDESRANTTGKVLTKAYSGFVHAASPHIMDMCGGDPPRFDVRSEFSELRMASQTEDAMNYFYRGLVSMAYGAKALGDEELFSRMHSAASVFEKHMAAFRQCNIY